MARRQAAAPKQERPSISLRTPVRVSALRAISASATQPAMLVKMAEATQGRVLSRDAFCSPRE